MSKDLHSEISVHFGRYSVENLVPNRRNRFIKRYGETDNYFCRMTNYELLRWLVETPSRDIYHDRMLKALCRRFNIANVEPSRDQATAVLNRDVNMHHCKSA